MPNPLKTLFALAVLSLAFPPLYAASNTAPLATNAGFDGVVRLYPDRASNLGPNWIATLDDYAISLTEFEAGYKMAYQSLITQYNQIGAEQRTNIVVPTEPELRRQYVDSLILYEAVTLKALEEKMFDKRGQQVRLMTLCRQALSQIYFMENMPTNGLLAPTDREITEYYNRFSSQFADSGMSPGDVHRYIVEALKSARLQAWQADFCAQEKERFKIIRNQDENSIPTAKVRLPFDSKSGVFSLCPLKFRDVGDNWIVRIDDYAITKTEFFEGASAAYRDYLQQFSELPLEKRLNTKKLTEQEYRQQYLDQILMDNIMVLRMMNNPVCQWENYGVLFMAAVRMSIAQLYVAAKMPALASFTPDKGEIDLFYRQNRQQFESSGADAARIIDYITAALRRQKAQEWQKTFREHVKETYRVTRNTNYIQAGF